jgi:hypothetical protein
MIYIKLKPSFQNKNTSSWRKPQWSLSMKSSKYLERNNTNLDNLFQRTETEERNPNS